MKTLENVRRLPGIPVTQHPEIVSGVPVFEGTRVPVDTLFEYLSDGYTIDEFLESFPSVGRESAIRVLLYGQDRIRGELRL